MGHYLIDTCSFWVSNQFFTIMSLRKIDFSQVIRDDQIYDQIMNNYNLLGRDWIAHQWNWMNNVYRTFKDHYKYMIIISLVEKTLQFYDQMNIQYSYDEYYSKPYLHIEKFAIIELCEKLKLPKETVRRKVLELEKLGVLKRKKRQMFIDRTAFNLVKPEQQMKFTSKYIYSVSEILNKNKIYTKKLNTKYIEQILKKNFSLTWSWFYRMQIPMVIGYHDMFEDVATFHIWGTVAMNQAFNYKKSFTSKNIHTLSPDYMTFNKSLLNNEESESGLSAMSISDMTSIPRATVVRKCKYLIKNDYLILNKKKQYKLTGYNLSKILPYQREVIKNKAKFIRKVLNLLVIS